MRMYNRPSSSIVLLFLLISFFTWNCSEKKEASKAPVVSKKIAAPDLSASPSGAAPKDEAMAQSEPQASEVAVGGATARIYDPAKRLNPFIPLYGSKQKEVPEDSAARRKKRIPQTPLERISLDQLKLVAIIRASTGNRALVEDTVGKGYIIKNGTYIGLNAGMVTQINAENVIIEEEVENLKGELVLQSTEIKLQKPAGE